MWRTGKWKLWFSLSLSWSICTFTFSFIFLTHCCIFVIVLGNYVPLKYHLLTHLSQCVVFSPSLSSLLTLFLSLFHPIHHYYHFGCFYLCYFIFSLCFEKPNPFLLALLQWCIRVCTCTNCMILYKKMCKMSLYLCELVLISGL